MAVTLMTSEFIYHNVILKSLYIIVNEAKMRTEKTPSDNHNKS
jgi:hypothetical protein